MNGETKARLADTGYRPKNWAAIHRCIMMQRCYDGVVRTTVDIPEDLHALAVAIARDTHQTLSQTVTVLMRRGLSSGGAGEVRTSDRTGLPVVHLGRTITTEDVRRLEDDDQ